MTTPDLSRIFAEYRRSYDAEALDRLWQEQSQQFRKFWDDRVMSNSTDTITDEECDKVIRILDRNAKGSRNDEEAVAKAMVAQGAWRRLLNELHANKTLGSLVTDIFREGREEQKAALVDKLYRVNKNAKNHLTGQSGNVIGAFLAAYDPQNNLGVISLRHRRALIEYMGLPVPFDWESGSIGQKVVASNRILIEGFRSLGITGSARTLTRFCYFPTMKALWMGEHTVRRVDKVVSVVVPTSLDAKDEEEESPKDEIRESMQIQALIAKIGSNMGFSIWLPKADRGRVLKAWTPKPGALLEELPLGYDPTTMKTIEQIDVIWLRKRSIARAFEVEHTTSVYSGLLRMADLVALQPDINVKLHIVAPAAKRDKVMQEIQRPVFSLLEGRALSDMCTFLSYDSLKEIGEERHLAYLSDGVIENYEEKAE